MNPFLSRSRVTLSQALGKILVHTVFSTKNRRPCLRERTLKDELQRYLRGVLNHPECQPLIVWGVEDRVHILSTLSRTCQPAKIVKEVKRGSSLRIKTGRPDMREFDSTLSGLMALSIGHPG